MAATSTEPTDKGGPNALAAIFRHRWLVLGTGLLLGLAVYALSASFMAPRYEATAVITLSKDRPFDPTTSSAQPVGDPAKWANLQAATVASSSVLSRAQSQLPVQLHDTFRDRLDVTALNESSQVVVTAWGHDAAEAALIADSVAQAYRAVTQDSVAALTAAALQVAGDDEDQQAQIRLNATAYGTGVSVIDPAEQATAPAAPRPWQLGLLAGLVGLLGAAAAVAWGAHLKQRVEPSPLPGVAELGRWREVPSKGALFESDGPAARSCGLVLVGLQHLGHLHAPRLEVGSILVTATTGSAAGLATGLAAAAARTGRRVVLVDADDSGHHLSTLGAPTGRGAARGARGTSRSSSETRPWVIGGGAVVEVMTVAATLQPQAVGADLRRFVEAGCFVIVVGDSVVSSPVAFAVAGEVDAVLVQVEPEPRAEVVDRTLAQLAIAAPAVVAQVVVGGSGRPSRTRSSDVAEGVHVAEQPARGPVETSLVPER